MQRLAVLAFVGALVVSGCDMPEAPDTSRQDSREDEPALSGEYENGGPWMVVARYDDDAATIALSTLVAHYSLIEGQRAARVHIDDLAHWRRLEAAGFALEVIEDDTAQMHADLARAAEVRAFGGQADGIPGFECYRTVDETYAMAEGLATDYPDLVEWIDIGDTWLKTQGQGGDDLMVIKVTNQAIAGPKPILWLTGAIHARELATAELVTRFVEDLVEGYGTDADATWIIDHHEVHAVLQANPDGRRVTESGTARRKNANTAYCARSAANRGVDLNRNWPFKFGNRGTSTSECSDAFRGPEAMSEPESAAFVTYMRSIFPDQRNERAGDFEPAPADATGVYLDIHSFGELIMWPYGFTDRESGNAAAFRAFGQRMAYFSGYDPRNLLPSSGSTAGSGYGELGIAALAFELGTSFFQDCRSFEASIAPDNLQSLLYAAKVARTPYLTPFGPDAIDLAAGAEQVPAGTPVEISVTADDGRFQAARSTPRLPSIENIAAVEMFVDTPPWAAGAEAIALEPVDGAFNSSVEAARGQLDTAGLEGGQHTVFVQATDSAGNVGPVSAVFVTVVANQPPAVTITAPTAGESNDATIALAATATDPEDGDLSAIIEWESDLDGDLATGAEAEVTLSVGTHAITASVVDAAGSEATDTVTVTVADGDAPGGDGDGDAPGGDGDGDGPGGDGDGDGDGPGGPGDGDGDGGESGGCAAGGDGDGGSAAALLALGLVALRRRRSRVV